MKITKPFMIAAALAGTSPALAKSSKIVSTLALTPIVEEGDSKNYGGWEIALTETVTGGESAKLTSTTYCNLPTGGVIVQRALGLVSFVECADGSQPVSSDSGFFYATVSICGSSKSYLGSYSSPAVAPGTDTINEGCNGTGQTMTKATMKTSNGTTVLEELTSTLPGLDTQDYISYNYIQGTPATLPKTLYNPSAVTPAQFLSLQKKYGFAPAKPAPR
jgi:hypothetical protein